MLCQNDAQVFLMGGTSGAKARLQHPSSMDSHPVLTSEPEATHNSVLSIRDTEKYRLRCAAVHTLVFAPPTIRLDARTRPIAEGL